MDDILREVRKAREAYGQKFGYDLQAIHRDLKAQEQASGRRIVSLPPGGQSRQWQMEQVHEHQTFPAAPTTEMNRAALLLEASS